jgi:drug/metabolite transporter (DMT)-like permease
MNYRLFIHIIITLLFFSTSSVLARAALIEDSMDAYSFTFFRLLSGALVLVFLLYLKNRRMVFELKSNWFSAFFLFLYAICFSYAYLNLDAGLGALILFAVVQLLILSSALFNKEKFTFFKVLGIVLAFAGLIYLLYPTGEIQLSLSHVLLMVISGIGWGCYTLLGKSCTDALVHTSDNFVKSVLFLLLFYFFVVDNTFLSVEGIVLAVISGGVTSALGYVLWYMVLPQISMITSGILQLLVPPMAIFLGVIFLDELFGLKLFLSTTIILIGIAITILSQKRRTKNIKK